jgi:gliding motility-associated-like protein
MFFNNLKALFAFILILTLFNQVKSQNPVPFITLSQDSTCVNGVISLSGTSEPPGVTVNNWEWSSIPATASFSAPFSQVTSFSANAPGTYIIKLIVSPGGVFATATVSIKPNPTFTLNTLNDTICRGADGITLTATGNAALYSWAPDSNLSSTTGSVILANPNSTTIYTVTAALGSCTVVKNVTVNVLPVSTVIATVNKNYVCTGDTTMIRTTAPNALSYAWSPTTGLSCDSCQNPIVNTLDTTIYTVKVTGNCFSNLIDTVIILPIVCDTPIAGFSFNKTICRYQCITFTDTSKYQPLTYKWYFQGGIPDSSILKNPRVCYNVESNNSPNGNGKYSVKLIVKNIKGLTDTIIDSIRVKISPVAIINNGNISETIDVGGTATLNASSYTTGGLYYNWTPNIGLSNSAQGIIQASPQVTTSYTVQVTNGLGCKDYDTILVKVEKICGEVFIPTAFSPNNDGINDYAKVLNNDCIKSMAFSIIDRWGTRVFYSEDPKKYWDGTFKGKEMDAGVFIYYFDGILIDDTEVNLKGNITLIR